MASETPRWLRAGSERSRQKAQAGLLLRISRANAAAIQSAEPDAVTGSALHRNDSEMVPSWLRDGSEPWRSRQKAQAGLLLRISRANTAAIQSAESDVATGSALHRNDSEQVPNRFRGRYAAGKKFKPGCFWGLASCKRRSNPVCRARCCDRQRASPERLRDGSELATQQAKSSSRVASED